MEVILKFFKNAQHTTANFTNDVLSRSMMKVAVVTKFMLKEAKANPEIVMPKDGEFWKCRIVKETDVGRASGCLIVEPMELVSDKDILKLIPGTYDIALVNGKLVVRPHLAYRGKPWILSLEYKRMLAREHGVYCIIVDINPTDVTMEDGSVVGPKIYGHSE
jgi:hypothetical protein